MVKTGVVTGRFQVLHLKSMEYILAAKMRCEKLYIGIDCPDDRDIRDTVNDGRRAMKESNPFTYYERFEMIRDALLDFGVKREEFDIIPFPIDRPKYVLQYAPADAVFFLSITDAWGEEKLKMLNALEVETEVLWRKSPQDAGTTGAEVRKLIREYKPWGHLVPKSVYEYIIKNELDERIRSLAG